MTKANEPEAWVKPGTKVASVRLGQRKEVVYSKIDRIGKVWLFLENGQRFHKLGLDRQEGGAIGGARYRLYRANDPNVQEHQMDIDIKKIMTTATKLAEEFYKEPSVEAATGLVEALIHFTPYELTAAEF